MTRLTFAAAMAAGWLCSTAALADFKAYEVEARYRQEVYEALRDLLAPPNSLALGRAEMLPTGQILVNARAETLQQIEAVLEGIAQRQPAPAPRVTLRYWVVLGSADAASQQTAVPEFLRDVIDELERVNGPSSYSVVGSASLMTESGQRGVLEGTPLSIEQETYADGSTLYADLGIDFAYLESIRPRGDNFPDEVIRSHQQLDLKTTIQAGEFVVLGENTVDAQELDGKLFYIVHWPAAE